MRRAAGAQGGARGWGGAGPASRHLIKRLRVSREQRAHSAVASCPRGGAAGRRARPVPGVGLGAAARGGEGGRGGSSAAASDSVRSAGRPLQVPAPLPVRPPMAAAGQLCLLYLSAGLLPRLGSAFNLDAEEDNVIRKYGDPGSLFGFSLAMHWQLQPEDKRL